MNSRAIASHVSPATAAPAAGSASATAPGSPRRLGFEFHGSGGEYFRVWIVNVMLSIVTLGVYSAWAKVRNKQYFYGNTRLGGAAFEYTANPVSILKGRLLVVAVFIAYGVVVTLFPIAEPFMLLAAVALIPWVIVRALAFNARYSSHRNVRFGFDGDYTGAFTNYILLPIVGLLTLGLAYPWAALKKKRFIIENSRFGATRFSFHGTVGPMYAIYLKACALFAIPAVLAGAVWVKMVGSIAAEMGAQAAEGGATTLPPQAALWVTVAIVVLLLGSFVATIYLQTAVANYLWRHASLRENRFDLRLELPRMLWIQLSNLAMIVFSFGLLIPVARVRVARYRIERMAMLAVAQPNEFAAGERDRMNAMGEEFGEAFDLDLAV